MDPKSDSTLAELKQGLAAARAERDDALWRLTGHIAERDRAVAREAATTEILRVINSSPGELSLVFNTILTKAHDLCGVGFGSLQLYENEHFRAVATHGMPEQMAVLVRRPYQMLAPDSPGGRLLRGERFYQAADLAEEVERSPNPRSKAALDICGIRTLLFIPLRRGNELLGLITVGRSEVNPFVEWEIALLEAFAAQAAVATENARLITETREALEQQTATAEVLQVINSSPGDLMPVFDAMLEKAMRLCDAPCGYFLRRQDDNYFLAAGRGLATDFETYLAHMDQPRPGEGNARALQGEPYIHLLDLKDDEAYRAGAPLRRAAVDLGGLRTGLLVPLRKDGEVLGTFSLARQEVRPFTDKQIALVQNFAAQAVIAMENARLLTETRETLEQQTATSEVLGVINASPGNLAPVFEAMLEKAMLLCEAAFGFMMTYDGERFRPAAQRGVPEPLAAYFSRGPDRPGPGEAHTRVLAGETVIHSLDYMDEEAYRQGNPLRRAVVDLGGARTALVIALRRDGALLGTFTIYRQEVRSFTHKQIALLQNFAAQAVIAMENARLITETREALEQQTATADVLGVINSSPGDLSPVWDAMLEKAMRLCEASFGGLWSFEGDRYVSTALRGVPTAFADFLAKTTLIPGPGSAPYRFLRGERSVLQNVDLAAEELYRVGDPQRRALVDLGGARTALHVPLCRDETALGVITIYRKEVRAFTEKQIALLQSFAAQAVIAMENARLITETREALEQQTATAEVLGVINSSPGDLAPVFDAMLESALRLCGAAFGQLWTYDGPCFEMVASRGVPAEYAELVRGPQRLGRGTAHARLVAGERIVHIADLAAEELYRSGDPHRRATVDVAGARSLLGVPLLKDEKLLGVLLIYRKEVRPFPDKQIALLQNFAAQAVIAMENARLITETREALEQQTATAEVLGVINASPGALAPVFDAMLEKAMRLCEAAFGTLLTYDGERVRPAAARGVPAAFAEFRKNDPPEFGPESGPARILLGLPFDHTLDAAADELYRRGDPRRRALVELGGARTILAVPLRKDSAVLGVFTIYRQEVRPFTDKQIALLQNFAAQAVIAMENARLITETREALDQQTATAEVLGVINSSPGDLTPVFDAMLERALRLCGAAFGELRTYDGERFVLRATHDTPEAYVEHYARRDTGRYGAGTGPARLLEGEAFVHIPDLVATEPYRRGDPDRRAIVDIAGARAYVLVPLLLDNAVRGFILIYRKEARPFTDKQIALLQNFAAQAVIAMENTRLITETREALEQQTATAEVLGVINSSPGDLAPVFEVMVERAAHLCEADEAAVRTFDGELLHLVTTHGTDPSALERLRGLGPTNLSGLYEPFAHGDEVVHYFDARDTDAYRNHQAGRQRIDARGIRSWLAVALRKEGTLLGIINVHRREVRPFTDKQIALLRGFAAQAVIAIENARLLDEIRQRQAELRVTFDNMADGVVMFDEELRLAAWNRNFQELLDLPDAVLAERPSYTDYLRILAERGEFGTDDIEAELGRRLERTDQEFRTERTRPDGRVIEVRRNAVPDGGFVLIYSDITERKRSEAEIRAARDAAEAALRDLKAAQANLVQAEKMASLGQLTAGIAHEIKNPLNFVNNFASLSNELLEELKEEAEPALATLDGGKRAEIDETLVMLSGNLEKIVEHGKRADNIVKSMLEHSRGVSGERREVDLNILIDEALNLAYHGARAQDQGFNITLERAFDPALAQIELAPQEITRVFLNLFGNGFYAANKRAREDGDGSFRPVLKVATRDLGDAVEIRVRDNGTGIPDEIKDKLFQPFFTTKPTGEGTGLGLSISYDIVTQQHGGTIEVASEEGAYTEFTIRLPHP